jgi:hypothetical protein
LSGQYSVRWFRDSDLPAYIRGLNETLYDEYDEARFRWKMVDTPYSLGFVSIATVEYNGVPVAFNSFLPLRVGRGDDVFQIIQGCDGLVEPEHRRMGLFQETLKFMFKELAGRGPEMLVGFNFSGSAGAAQKVGSALAGDFHALVAKAPDLAKVETAGEDEVDVIPCSLDEMHRLHEDWAKTTTKLHIEKTPDYLRWRHNHPIRRSSFYRIRDGEQTGYAAVSLERDKDSNTLFLEDYSPVLHSPRAAMALIRRVIASGEPLNEVYLTEAVGSKMYSVAQQLGFTPDHAYTMILRNISGLEERDKRLFKDGVELTGVENWCLTSCDVF